MPDIGRSRGPMLAALLALVMAALIAFSVIGTEKHSVAEVAVGVEGSG